MSSISQVDPGLRFSFFQRREGVEIHETVLPLEHESIIKKHFPNSFLKTELERKLKEKGVTKLVVVGMMTHMCIDATVRAAVDLGYETTLIEDACATELYPIKVRSCQLNRFIMRLSAHLTVCIAM